MRFAFCAFCVLPRHAKSEPWSQSLGAGILNILKTVAFCLRFAFWLFCVLRFAFLRFAFCVLTVLRFVAFCVSQSCQCVRFAFCVLRFDILCVLMFLCNCPLVACVSELKLCSHSFGATSGLEFRV